MSNVTSLGQSSQRGVKRKRNVLTLNQKIELCKRIQQGVKRSILKQEYNIATSTISDIYKQKDELLKLNSNSEKDISTRKILSKPKCEQLDSMLYEWFKRKRSEGISVSGPMLIEKARALYNKLDMQQDCGFSDGWLTRFKERHGIRRLSVAREIRSADHETAAKFVESFAEVVNKQNLTAEQIYNAKETGVFWRCLPTPTLTNEGEVAATRGFKRNMERVTVLVCANAAGTHKCELLVIGKYFHPRAFINVSSLPVIYKAHKKAWMDKEIFKEWFMEHFILEVKEHFKTIGIPEDSSAILLIDNCRAHPPKSELVYGNINAQYLPPNVTSLIQPMDQGIILSMKFAYKVDFLRQLANYEGSVQSFQSTYNIKDAVYNMSFAWQTIKQNILRRGWKRLWPVSVINEGSSAEEDFENFDGRSKRAIEQLFQVIREASPSNPVTRLSEDEVQEWLETALDGQASEIFPDSQLNDGVAHPTELITVTYSEEDSTECEENLTWDKVIHYLEEIQKFTKRKGCFNAYDVKKLTTLKRKYIQKKELYEKKSSIKNPATKNPQLEGSSASTTSTSSDVGMLEEISKELSNNDSNNKLLDFVCDYINSNSDVKTEDGLIEDPR